ncbi:MAG TPA: ABC transporter permease [Burkholderiales bacterium]|nr:ABC transporter permease [Burkholderiales bacterium]
MRPADVVRFAWVSLRGYPARTALMGLAMAIGVAAVVILTALGDGARRYVVKQFSSLGTNLLIVFPGRSETAGATPGMFIGQTPRDLTLDDALALTRSRAVRRVAPLSVGSAQVSFGGRSREAPVVGSTADWLAIRNMQIAQGSFLPPGDPRAASPVCVIGATVRDELFGSASAVGQFVRIGNRRFRVGGILVSQGQHLGFNTDEMVIVPVAAAQAMFNTNTLLRILIEARSREELEAAKRDVTAILQARHEGELDVTVVTQDAVLATFDRVLGALTLAVAGIAAISLAVAGILIMNVMLIAVSQRTREIGLLKAVGATPAQIRLLFFAEAVLLSCLGAMAGLAAGFAGNSLIVRVYPVLPAAAPAWAVAAALVTAVATGVLFSIMPARRAARLDPVAALSRR